MVEAPHGRLIEKEVPLPIPRRGEVRIRVYASGINPLDTKIRAGEAAHARQPLPAILGLDVAGVVDAVGEGTERSVFREGDAVFGMVGGVGGLPGSHAEYVTVDASLLAHKPGTLSMREAAALPLVAITAWEGLVDRAAVTPGQRVLVHAGAGGVGHAAIQLARARGATVFTTVSPAKRAVIDATRITPVDYTTRSTADYVQDFTEGEGFDVVYDTVGGSTLDESFKAVKRYTGHVVSCLGWGSHSLSPLSFKGATYSGVFTLLPLLTGIGRAHHGDILKSIAALVDRGEMRPLLYHAAFGSDDWEAAYQAVVRQVLGKVVVEIP